MLDFYCLGCWGVVVVVFLVVFIVGCVVFNGLYFSVLVVVFVLMVELILSSIFG